MKSRPLNVLLPAPVLILAGSVIFLAAACSDPQRGSNLSGESAAAGLEDRALEDFQDDLLGLAFDAATKLPVEPHIKNRSRAQEAVVEACLRLEQPKRALAYIEKIGNWRRGACYADLAYYCAERGDAAGARKYLELAERDARAVAEEEGVQIWRRDRIMVKIARTYALLGEAQKAARYEAGVVDSEAGKVDAVRAMTLDGDAFDAKIAALDEIVHTGTLDQARNALQTYAGLFARFYDDGGRRALIEARIDASMSKVPVMVGIELLTDLAGTALDRDDRAKALELVNKAHGILENSKWVPEHRIPIAARLAGLRFRAGDAAMARTQADALLALFEAEREKIVDIYRAETLLPLAEAYQAMGDWQAALEVYRMAVEEGVANPNSRPRAVDLSATCCSMALHGVRPDAGLRDRMNRIYEELDHPW
jgi:tetratricopeptide (TPR) repeat protein